jgi:hypothetical protein
MRAAFADDRHRQVLGLGSHAHKCVDSINSSMAESQEKPLQPIPPALSHLIHLNVEFGVLVCLGVGCSRAVAPATFSEHLRRKHSTPMDMRKQVDTYTQGFPYQYDYKTIIIPIDGNAPQPVVPIVDGFQCQHCRYRSQSRRTMKDHWNQQHSMKRAEDDELFQPVRLQTWFRDGKERYWVVDESKQAQPVGVCL